MSKLTGGGINSKVVVRGKVIAGAATRDRVNVSAVSMLGAKRGNHSETGRVNVKPQPLFTGQAPQVALGNQLCTNVGKGGPGRGRTIYKTGSQGRR